MNIEFNANLFVKVKLTDVGVKILEEKKENICKLLNIEFKGLNLDAQGYYKEQLWCLMADFGEYLKTPEAIHKPPFDMNMVFMGAKKIEKENEL